jgi:hypothetical protein
MDREKIIGVLYIMTFLLAAYIKFTNPHFFATTSTKGIHDGSNVAYLGQYYEDRLVWNVPMNETAFSLLLWREVFLSGEPSRLNRSQFFSDADQTAPKKRCYDLKRDEAATSDPGINDRFGAVRLFSQSATTSTEVVPVALPELELRMSDKLAKGIYKITMQIGTAPNVVRHDTIVTLTENNDGGVFFHRQFPTNEIFNVRLWKKVDIDLPDVNHKLLGRSKKRVNGQQTVFYNLNNEELTINLDTGQTEKQTKNVQAKDRELMVKLFADNSKLAGVYGIDVTERTGRIHFDSHIFEISPKAEFTIVYPDFSTKPEQLAGVPYHDFVVTTQPMDAFSIIVADQNQVDTMTYRITNISGAPVATIVNENSREQTQIKVNQDRKIVSFEVSLKSPKHFKFIARAGRLESSKSWEVPIQRLAFSVWPPIQPRYWRAKENVLYDEFCKKYSSQLQLPSTANSTTPLLYEGRKVSVYYDVENVNRSTYTDVLLRFSTGATAQLKSDASPVEFTLPADITWVELIVKIKETALSAVFAVKSVPDNFTYQVDLSPPLEMVSEYGMSTFQIHDYFDETIASDAIQVEVTGAPQNQVRLNKEKDRVKLELVGIKNNHNIRARIALVQSPYNKSSRNMEIGKIALKN